MKDYKTVFSVFTKGINLRKLLEQMASDLAYNETYGDMFPAIEFPNPKFEKGKNLPIISKAKP